MIYIAAKLVFRSFLGILGNCLVTGEGHIPRTGPVIVVANHTSLLDGFILAAFWPRRVTFLSVAYLFRLPVVGVFLRAMGAIPVQDKGKELAGMRKAIRVLQAGGTIALFPEGRVGRTDMPGPFHTGWAYLALKVGAPVLPVAIKGSSTALSSFPRRSKIHMQIAIPWMMAKVPRPRQDTLTALNVRLLDQMERMLDGM